MDTRARLRSVRHRSCFLDMVASCRSARFRFARQHHCSSATTCLFSTSGLAFRWDLRESMREADVEVILERAKEKYPEAKPRIISDNDPEPMRHCKTLQLDWSVLPWALEEVHCLPTRNVTEITDTARP